MPTITACLKAVFCRAMPDLRCYKLIIVFICVHLRSFADKNYFFVSFVGWARFFAHAERPANTWAKKRAHPTVTTKDVAFYLRVFAFICGKNCFILRELLADSSLSGFL